MSCETYLERKRRIIPVDYVQKKKSMMDVVIDVKSEKINSLKKSVGILHNDLLKIGQPIDLSEDDISESVEIMLDADEVWFG